MVQFWQPSEDDPTVSLHIWNGGVSGSIPFGCKKSNCGKLVPPSVVMPNLEVFKFSVTLENNSVDCGNFGLEYLPSLREVKAYFNCNGVSAAEGDAALAALRIACEVHPNHPTLIMDRYPKVL